MPIRVLRKNMAPPYPRQRIKAKKTQGPEAAVKSGQGPWQCKGKKQSARVHKTAPNENRQMRVPPASSKRDWKSETQQPYCTHQTAPNQAEQTLPIQRSQFSGCSPWYSTREENELRADSQQRLHVQPRSAAHTHANTCAFSSKGEA